MFKRVIFIVFIVLSLADMAFGYEITVVKSCLCKINEQVQRAFIDQLTQHVPDYGLKSIQPHQMAEVLIGKEEEPGESSWKIRKTHPDLILALGDKALKAALSALPDTPTVYLLVIDPEKIIGKATKVTGVALAVPPKAQLDELIRYLPAVKRIGLVYDPKRSGKFVEQLKSLRTDLNIISLPADNSAAVPGLINSLRGRVDLLWMLPDITTTTPITLQSYFVFSIKNKIPLLTFSESFLRHGATIAITFDVDAVVRQAVDLAIDMLSDGERHGLPTVVAPQVKTVVNDKIATKLDIAIAGGGHANE